MTTYLRIPQRAHWYTRDGQPMHEVPKKDGSGFKPTTIREAREMDLLPSATNILGIVNKYGLNTWKVSNYVQAAARLPRKDGEDDMAFAQRVIDEAGEETFEASTFGTRLHSAIAGHGPVEPDLAPYHDALQLWCDVQGLRAIATEESFTAKDYGGTLDWRGTIARWPAGEWVLDWTTQRTQPNKKPNFYAEKGAQLAAYAMAKGVDHIATVVISYTEVGRIESKVWPLAEMYVAFQAAKELWKSPLGPGATL